MSESGGMRKWVVLTSSAFSVFLGGSLSYCSGVFHVALLHHYQHDLVETAWLGSLFSCMFAVTGPISSLVVNTYSCRVGVMTGALLVLIGFTSSAFVSDMRWLFITYSILVGTGEGLVFISSQVILGYYFPKKTSMAVGFSLIGTGMSTFIFPPVSQYLIDYYGLAGCFLILGSVGFQSAVFGALLKPNDLELKISKRNKSRQSVCKTVTDIGCWDLFSPAFALYIFSVLCLFMGNSITYLFMPDYFRVQGASVMEASLLVSMIGIGGLISRTLGEFAASEPKIGPVLVYSTTFGLTSVLTFLTHPMSKSLRSRTAYAFMFGLYASPGCVQFAPITLHLVGMKRFASAYGLLMVMAGVGTLVGPPLAGLLCVASGSYKEAFHLAGSAFGVTSICGFLLTLLSKPMLKAPDEKSVGKCMEGERLSMMEQEHSFRHNSVTSLTSARHNSVTSLTILRHNSVTSLPRGSGVEDEVKDACSISSNGL